MKLREIQERMFSAIIQPLTASERMRSHGLDGFSLHREAEAIIKPNARLTSFDRLEIYNRQYWFRVLGSLIEDFPGLQAIVGPRRFEQLSQAYLIDHPSRSYTLRNLGAGLHGWLAEHPDHAGPRLPLALDMLRLEWANIEAFDAAESSGLSADDLLDLGSDPGSIRFHLQPYLRLVAASYPVDDIRLAIKDGLAWSPGASNAVSSNRGKAVKHRFTGLKPAPVHIAVHRKENTIFYKRLDAEEFRLLHELGRGRSLLQGIDGAFKKSLIPAGDRAEYVRAAFSHWTSLGWFCRG